MRTFLKKVLFFCLFPVTLLFVGILLPTYPAMSGSYLFAKIDKDTLLRKTPSPRIILVGGSNLALGLNSQMIKDSLNLNPVNTGIDYNIGLSYLLDNVHDYIQKGDIVIVASEYEQFFGRAFYGGYASPVIQLEVSPGHLQNLSFNQWINLARVMPGYAFPRLKVWKYFFDGNASNIENYTRRSFNRYGDHISHWKEKGKNPIPTKGYEGTFNDNVIIALAFFRDSIAKKGAFLLVSFPSYQATSFENNIGQIREVETALKNNHFLLLGTPERYTMPDSLMYDSPYHLIKKGIDMRTLYLIEDFKKVYGQRSHI